MLVDVKWSSTCVLLARLPLGVTTINPRSVGVRLAGVPFEVLMQRTDGLVKISLPHDGWIIGRITNVDCPNSRGGIGNVTMDVIELWTGGTHLFTPQVSFHTCSVKEVATRSNLNETNELWAKVKLPIRPKSFEYSYWLEVGEILKGG